MTTPSFLSVEAAHGEMHEEFLRHQDALLARDLARAAERLESFSKLLRAHMAVEEELLLPLYAERCGRVPGGSPEFFRAEHRKLIELLEGLQRALASLPAGERAIVRLFDEEYQFKSLLEHHDMREHNILFPKLDEVTSPEERERLLAAFGHARSH